MSCVSHLRVAHDLMQVVIRRLDAEGAAARAAAADKVG